MAELMAKGSKMFKIRNIWYGMLHRVNNPKNTNFKNYGNRGIVVCDSWLDFDTFYKDVESGYQEGLSLDRIDNNKGYFPDNIRWATKKEQARNKRNNAKLSDGRFAYDVSEVSHSQLRKRMYSGMSRDEAALTQARNRHLMPSGEFASDVALAHGVSVNTFNMRISRYGWDVIRAATTPPRPIRNHHHIQP